MDRFRTVQRDEALLEDLLFPQAKEEPPGQDPQGKPPFTLAALKKGNEPLPGLILKGQEHIVKLDLAPPILEEGGLEASGLIDVEPVDDLSRRTSSEEEGWKESTYKLSRRDDGKTPPSEP